VKVRGFRIEPGEIEVTLRQHPAVSESVVLAREDQPGDKRLVAYVVAKPDAMLNASELCQFLSEKLPAYMVPGAFVILDRWPLTPKGKIDPRALPAPELAQTGRAEPRVAPRTAAEETLAEIWRDVLGVKHVGVSDNFFELGGHSLLVTQVVSRVREAFQVDLPLRRLFERPTIAATAAAIEERLVRQIQDLSEQEVQRLAADG